MCKLRLSWFLVVLLAVSLVAALPVVNAQSGTSVGGVISQDQTWTTEGSPYTLTGNILIEQEAALYIAPGVTVNFGGYFIRVAGTLDVSGTADNKIVINVASSEVSGPVIEFQSTSQNCILQYTNIESSRDYFPIIQTSDASPKVDNNIVTAGSDGYAIWCSGNRAPEVSNNQISGRLYLHSFEPCVLTNNKITCPSDITVNIHGSATLLGNIISGSAKGILCHSQVGVDRVTLQRNLIVGNTIGLSVGQGYPANDFKCQLTVQHNTIAGNVAGIVLDSECTSEAYNLPIIRNNNIYDNSIYNVHTYTAIEMDLSSNWWGTTDTQTISQKNVAESEFGTLKILIDPILSSPDAEAPSYTAAASTTPAPEVTLQPSDTLVPPVNQSSVDANPQTNSSSSSSASYQNGEPDYTTMAYGLGIGVAIAVAVIVAVVLAQRVKPKSSM